MQRRAVLVLLIAACTQTPTKTPAQPTARCIQIDEANAESARARQRNERRFKDQLAANGLEVIAFASAGTEDREQPDITVETRTIGGVPKQVLVTPSWTCATGAIQLAKNAQSELYALDIRTHATNGSISACGCQVPASASCGGAAVRPITILYILPDELTYKGTIAIEYDVDPDNVLYTGRRSDGSSCPPPPSPPP